MKPPKQNAHVSLIGTILIMWLMVGYVYLLNPVETLPSQKSDTTQASRSGTSAVSAMQSSDESGAARLSLLLEKDHYRPQEPVRVVAQLSGLEIDSINSSLASLLIEDDIQVLGPVTFIRQQVSGDYVTNITLNPATGLPLTKGSYKVVVRAGTDLVAAVAFQVESANGRVAFQH